MTKCRDQKQCGGGKGLSHLTACSPLSTLRELKAGTWRQELKQRTWRRAAHWLPLHGLLIACFLIAARTTSPGVAPPTVSWLLPHLSSIKKKKKKKAPQAKSWPARLARGKRLSPQSCSERNNGWFCSVSIETKVPRLGCSVFP